MKRRLAVAALLLMLAGVAAVYHVLHRPYAGFEGERLVEIPRGATSRQIATQLAVQGIVRHEYLFLAARALRPRQTLQAGEYLFREPASAWEVLGRLARGDIHYYELRVPEGSNIFETARIVGEMGFVTAEEFLDVARDPEPVRDLDPEAQTLEGYLFPSTYYVTRHTTAAEIAGMMTSQFRKTWLDLGANAETRDAVILASLVEKETAVGSERPLIAAVFHNRLRRGIKLECDPTVVYAAILEDKWRGMIHRSDLDRQHPYNTYLAAGLPPGPIASPGEEALRATLQPADSGYLFFVAKPDDSGEHVFSETLAAHNRAVRDYRRGRKKTLRQASAE